MIQQELMRLVAHKAVDTYVKSDMIVGLGTGRTSTYAVERLAELLKSKKIANVHGVATSRRTSDSAKHMGIPLLTLDEVTSSGRTIDVALDGADAVDSYLNLIKGGGGAMFREFLVEQYAKELIIMVDHSKIAKGHLLESFHLPIEVVKEGYKSTCEQIRNKFKEHISELKVRKREDGSLFKTDNHNVVVDVLFKAMPLEQLYRDLKMVHGVVCSGLFLDMVTKCLVARADGTVSTLEKKLPG